MNKIFFCLIFLIAVSLRSQTYDFNNYVPLQSSGVLPVEFTKSSTAKYQDRKDEIKNARTRTERQAKDEFYLESIFAVDDILQSGRVLFNDTIGQYLTAVMNTLLEHRETKKDVRVFCIKSTVVNAYTTGNGMIFITTGLLARLKTEAQLAFILSHEYMHYVKKHSMKGYLETKRILKGQGSYSELSLRSGPH